MTVLNLTATQVQDLLLKLKSGMERALGELTITSKAMFINQLELFNKVLEPVGIKLYTLSGAPTTMDNIFHDLKLSGIITFQMHFPDGTKYETVTRSFHDNDRIYTFCHKL